MDILLKCPFKIPMEILEIKLLKLITHWWYNNRLDTAEEENEK